MKKTNCISPILSILVLLLLIIVACASNTGTVAPATSPARVQAPTPEHSGEPAWEKKLEELAKAARKEGSVVIYSSAGTEARTALVPAFKEKYGVNLEWVSGRGGEIVAKLLNERKSGLYLADVYLGNAASMANMMKPQGAFDRLESALLLPELTRPEEIKKVWWNGQLVWTDPDHYILNGFLGKALPLIINTNLVKQGAIKSYQDLLSSQWKRKIIFSDPSVPGFGQTWFAVAAARIVGEDYMRELVKQEPAVTKDLRLQVESVAQGKYPLALCPQTDVVGEFMKAGAPIMFITPVEGVHLSVSLSSLGLINRASHPNAARLFINWLLSREGQTLYSEALLYPSARMDVPKDKIPSAKVPVPGEKYFIAEEEAFLIDIKPKMDKLALEIFGPLTR